CPGEGPERYRVAGGAGGISYQIRGQVPCRDRVPAAPLSFGPDRKGHDMAKDKPTLPTAYSYIRFSHPDQAKGDSLRRQTEAAAEWCKVKGVTLDASTTLHDLGKSAFLGKHRENPDRHALAAFLKLAEGGRIPTGSYLLIENLDRLSREEEVPACHLLTSILMKGIKVVQMMPSEMLLTDKSNGWELMRAVMELSRGHNES